MKFLEDPITEESLFLRQTPLLLLEGLIKTYPIEISSEAFASVFKLEKVNSIEQVKNVIDNIKKGELKECNGAIMLCPGENQTKRIMIFVNGNEHNKFICDEYLNKYGYFCCSISDYFYDFSCYTYDKKFDIDATDFVFGKKYLYHITRNILKEKILRNGLTPKDSQWKHFSHSGRLYFFFQLDEDKINRIVANMQMSKKENNYLVDDSYMVLKIDTSKLNNIKFYFDPRAKNAVYTMENVHPEAIKIIKEKINGNFY